MGWEDRTGLKWWSYTALFFLLFFLERCVLNRFPLWGAVPRLAPLAVAAVGFWEGSFSGAVFSLGAGLLCALTAGTEGAGLIWQYTAIGIACGTTVNKTLGRSLLGYLLCALGSLLFLEGVEVLVRLLFLNQAAEPVCRIAGGEGLYSLLFAPLVYPAFRGVCRRFRTDMEFKRR